MVRRCLRPIIAICAAFLAAAGPHLAAAEKDAVAPRRQLEIGVVDSDEMVEAVLTVTSDEPTIGIGADDHALITAILASTKELVETASYLVQHETSLSVGQDMMEEANNKLREVKDHIVKINGILRAREEEDEARELLRKKYSEHDLQKTQEDDFRALDVARNMYETMTTFPECVERLFEHCVGLINRDLRKLGLQHIEMVVNEKRTANQENYNKVVIVTNEAADKVVGRTGDGIVQYPYQWHDLELGDRTLSVDGKWDCLNKTPEECCAAIKASCPNPDTEGNMIECHIFVPFGGVGNPRREDRVVLNLSTDGRVHEPPLMT